MLHLQHAKHRVTRALCTDLPLALIRPALQCSLAVTLRVTQFAAVPSTLNLPSMPPRVKDLHHESRNSTVYAHSAPGLAKPLQAHYCKQTPRLVFKWPAVRYFLYLRLGTNSASEQAGIRGST